MTGRWWAYKGVAGRNYARLFLRVSEPEEA